MELELQGNWDKASICDRITILAIYMPIIQAELKHFTRIWNIHNIRKQKNRPNSIPGQPAKNYFYPGMVGAEDQGYAVSDEVLDEYAQRVEDIGVFSCRVYLLHHPLIGI